MLGNEALSTAFNSRKWSSPCATPSPDTGFVVTRPLRNEALSRPMLLILSHSGLFSYIGDSKRFRVDGCNSVQHPLLEDLQTAVLCARAKGYASIADQHVWCVFEPGILGGA